ncbi:hypothetical protein C7U92_30645 [Bradyrhizobium sp. WBOS7]|uniref:Antitoxin SocA-like Panacea domain-containing protein n=2 Tax=Nitrobacteraceae TaxID=41294 RepID=A0AAE9N8D4_9BRAD|nr:hypothetical protein [Bradyrhizobium sp. WBOS2]MDD1571229.1 hypothetical protein [Bradyrhizobium sp. WBOS1]MDD1581046.1 hypothetical protein [Bradyrhizobium sp. WBOS7]MDD1601788.1 hypothetical protein [Bradyrhizobium sp. WBOS16]UUO34482.1 hypothetical protein DCK84_07765 [Bradyrhizobium sp. WBOS01]UUO39997.1 hypothetical protein DCM75_04025 [Bradyrhizobium sp. WBOS02]UUO52164.1 hypothetical protein DCM79_03670 [Bradyrhizobium sp. WBOS07]UUO65179.1 hypothetical protein DCM83_08090 [Bradyrh
MSNDVRAIANLVLDLADQRGRQVSNLSINKIVFFLHAFFLARFGKPLVSAKIEAWEYGPVFRELYREFKSCGDKPINARAHRINPRTGERELCEALLPEQERLFVEEVGQKFVAFSASSLVSMSHEAGGPWDQVWNHSSKANPSMQISDDLIVSWYAKAARH